jgi:hypothetical protein
MIKIKKQILLIVFFGTMRKQNKKDKLLSNYQSAQHLNQEEENAEGGALRCQKIPI